jgi:hypothetical protein
MRLDFLSVSGGKFVNGAFTASFSYLLNDLGNHDKEEKPTLSTSAKVGAVLGGTAGVVLAAGCDLATFATCAPANPMMVLGGAAGGAVLGATFGEALDRTTKAIGKLLHGNSWLSPEPSSVYALLSRFDGSIQKFGVTNLVGNETARYTSAEYERMDVRMVTISTHPTRAQALTTEKLYCFGYVAVVGRTPPLSKVC